MISDLFILLKHDLAGTIRIKNVEGKRSERRSTFRRYFRYVAAALFVVVILWGIVFMADLLGWEFFRAVIADNIEFGSTIFNFIVIMSFMGSIAISVSTVANSSRMEYLMIMPITLKTLFLEKTIVIIFYNAMIYLIIGTPIVIGFAIASGSAIALLSIPIFIVMLLANVTLGVSLGGLIGLAISRFLAGRRRLKQIGWFFGTAAGILFGTFYYFSIMTSDGGGFSQIFSVLFDIARMVGLSSDFSPGGAMNAVSLRLIVGLPISITDILLAILFLIIPVFLIYANAHYSEAAHYSGWLASGSKRSSKEVIKIAHTTWNPSDYPLIKMSETTSTSMWYNTASVRREGRVLANYLVGPLRMVLFMFLFLLTPGGSFFGFTSFIIMYAMVPFAVSYGVYFAGYELVYEGKNLMNLQLAPASLTDYVKGKVFSAVPFTLIATSVASVIVVILQPSLWIYIPALIISNMFLTVAAGGIASYSAATGGDFKAERKISRQRGSAVQMPIRSMWAMARAHLLPNMIGFSGLGLMLALGMFFSPLYTYLAVPLFALICIQIMRSYIEKAGKKLQTIEATEYM
ncbi:MAG: putative ABC transporter permease subunit [Candidatus Thorarchaeota archaeon]